MKEIRCIRCLRVLRLETKPNEDMFDCWLCGASNSLRHDQDNPPITVKIGAPKVGKHKKKQRV